MEDPDRTIRRRRPAPVIRHAWPIGVAALLISVGAGLWWYFGNPLSVPSPAPTTGRLPSTQRPQVGELADEATILDTHPSTLVIFRFAPNPRVLVLDFADLAAQGRMLDRVAALIEKAGLPRDRVLSDGELAHAIAASGATPSTYYYGHDYRAAALVRFFALAARDRVALNPDEQRLQALIDAAGWTTDPNGALISLPYRYDSGAVLDALMRATILRHELSHGEYFTNARYASYVHAFWTDVLDASDRALFRRLLGGEDYDQNDTDLMMNEMQAHLVHTPDARFFTARALGTPEDRLIALRARFVAGMPAGWLHDEDAALLKGTPPQGEVSRASALPAK